jgi:mannose/cellobiose epimerase-like protein (N-acyl-D-glucosamine 2-epimerase family)
MVLVLGSGVATHAHDLTSDQLRDPASNLPFLVECAEFWIPAWDSSQRAFFSNVGPTGQPTNADKAFLSQTRNAYAFSKAFMVTGDPDYLDYADGALRFMYARGWDTANSGWWGMANANGSINTGIWYNSTKWSFWQHYMLLGISALVEASGDPFHEGWLDIGNSINDNQLWDSRPGMGGYFNRANINWSNRREKGFTPTVDAITTSALTNYLMTRDPARLHRLVELGDNISDRMMNPAIGHVVSFPSSFNADWVVDRSGTTTSIGHHIKTAWCLARVFLMHPEPKYAAAARQLLDEIWYHEDAQGNRPWDHTHGIMRGDINVFTGAVGGASDWWTVEQGVTSGLMNWYVSRQPEYLEMADRSMRFFMDYYYDHTHGEVFTRVAVDGQVTDSNKGNMFKAGYHSTELFYLAYLYGNLYLHNKPVTLYYRYQVEPFARSVHLWPIAYEDDRLMISGVTRDGESYPHFESSARNLLLPPGEGGVFAVTFESRYTTNPPAHFDAGWWSDWFGMFYLQRDVYPWIYDPDHGWALIIGNSKDRAHWLYSASGGYFYHVAEAYHPFYYRADSGWHSR